ncbi:DUF2637 domain-containing protein [Mycobacterium attenuatum]|uniref:DUF2637 domain-containing protein n=1 Tax=Mycobacterium attenuatum TaxID=2341086 RepID=UPI0010A9509C|nr:DUF2637 domain-containing protein [Mycobacterium attenuatum]
MGSTEGVAMLVRARRGSSMAYWCALAMTALLAACAFVLSFDALQDLATRAGIDPRLAWLWPIAIDASIAQCTVALLSLTRDGHTADPTPATPEILRRAGEIDGNTRELEARAAAGHRNGHGADSVSVPVPEAAALAEEGVTKQPPEVISEVLRRHRAGQRVGSIATDMKLHHSTVNRLLNASHRRSTENSTY